ncbi:hypothetical protein QIH15_27280, partial [Klebsiella pneumoniae]|nr:hypothetical protein [Klebsiella pneumoniae]
MSLSGSFVLLERMSPPFRFKQEATALWAAASRSRLIRQARRINERMTSTTMPPIAALMISPTMPTP